MKFRRNKLNPNLNQRPLFNPRPNFYPPLHPEGYIFIGMSGSGKTTLGKIIAKRIGYLFLDSDQLIEKKFSGINLYKVVDKFKDNLSDFIKLESEIIKKIRLTKTVLATGGSACYSKEAIKEKRGRVIYLHISWELLQKRIGDFSKRGVICFEKDLKTEYKKRVNLYKELSDLTINCDNKRIKKLEYEILKTI